MKRFLLINPPDNDNIFGKSKISLGVPFFPSAALASLGGALLEQGHQVRVIDLRLDSFDDLEESIRTFKPDFAGITSTTPLFDGADNVAGFIKRLDGAVTIIAGGAHVSALKEDALINSNIDIVCIGEGEDTIREIAAGIEYQNIKGIAYKSNNNIFINAPRQLIKDLDSLPKPAWNLFRINSYRTSRLSCRKNPIGPIETSRGCPFGCVYCNKSIFGRHFRFKSVQRVVNEMEHLLRSGFREVHVLDDMFSTDLPRAKGICDEILKKKLKFPWSLINGIRIDRIDEELMSKIRKAGCYRVAFGVESGDDQILKNINKSLTVDKIVNGFKVANKSGIETVAFCMLGLPGETKGTMQKTIDLMKTIKPTMPKVSILLPLPGTPIFDEWDKQGLILTKNWADYSFHSAKRVYKHPNLTEADINHYYKKFWRELMLSPRFLIKRALRGLENGEIFYDAYYFIKSLKFGW